MSEEKAPAAAAPAPAPSEGGGGNKLVLILTLVNVLVTAGIVGVLVMSFQKQKTSTGIQDINAEAGAHGGDEKAAGGEHGGGGGGGHGGGGGGEHGAGGGKSKSHLVAGKMITLEQFTVNLATVGTVNPKFARVNISVEVPNDDAESEVNQKMPQVRNTIIDLFNSKKPADLATPEGRNFLKDEIKQSLNSFMKTGKVSGVYFTNFALSS